MHGIETLKTRINKGEFLVGVWASSLHGPHGLDTGKARLKEIWEQEDYAFLLVDSQHSPFNEDRLVEFCGNANSLDIPVIFRIKHTFHSYLVGNLLDLGLSGIEVPQVEEVSTVDEARGYFYYPQVGKRSWGGPRVLIHEHPDRIEYADWWNTHGVLWMQIESLRAVTGARKFLKSGVDCLSWGPADLSFDREAHPEHPFKTDDDCINHVLKLLDGSGVRLMIRSVDPDLRDKYREMGVTILLEPSKK